MPQRLLSFGLALLVALPAAAQVTVNPGALEQLGGGVPAPQATPPDATAPGATPPSGTIHPAVRRPPPPHRAAESKPVPAATARPAARPTPPAAAVPPVVPPAPPPQAVLKPLEPPPPAHPTTPPPPASVLADAPGEATPLEHGPDQQGSHGPGLRITFGPDRSDLNPVTEQAVQALARQAPAAVFTVTAYAQGVPSDPSTPRRLALSRALAVRSVLIAAGVPSTRIYARALGPSAVDGPPDRVDVTETGTPASPVITTATPGR